MDGGIRTKAQQGLHFVVLLKDCAKRKNLDKARRIHAEILRKQLLEKDNYIGSSLVSLYAKCGALESAREVSDLLSEPDVVSWTALMMGYASYGHETQALRCFEQMQNQGLSPDALAFVCVLKSCSNAESLEEGRRIHARIVGAESIRKNIVVGTTLVDMYIRCGLLAEARLVFDEIHVRNVVLWNTLIAGYVTYAYNEEAWNCFGRMRHQGFSPDEFTFTCILKACGSMGAIDQGKAIHEEIVRRRLLEKDALIGTALLDMWMKLGIVSKAQQVFDELPVQDTVSWTALIAGYAEHGEHGENAVSAFKRMQQVGVSPNAVTMVCILKACGYMGAMNKGKAIHCGLALAGKELPEEKSTWIGTALVDMYSKCGSLMDAHVVFDSLLLGDTASCTALITAYSQLGKHDAVVESFNRMLGHGVMPNSVTFTAALYACSHSGILDAGQMYYDTMTKTYGIAPTWEHNVCIVDLFSRAGCIDKAIAFMKSMPMIEHSTTMLISVLVACQRLGGIIELGKVAFDDAFQLGGKDAGLYVAMSNVYAALAE